MLRAVLTRITPGRPEAQLACVDLVPLRQSGDLSVHLVTGGADRLEQHVRIPEWDSTWQPVDLLAHALNVARAARELSADGAAAVVLPGELAAELCKIALASGQLDEQTTEDVRALMTQVLEHGRVG